MPNRKKGGALTEAMRATLRAYWAQAQAYQKLLYFVGFLLLASAVFHSAVLVVTRGSLEGDVSWRKPILFGESFGLTALSVTWVMNFLPKWRFLGWLLAGALSLANTGRSFALRFSSGVGCPPISTTARLLTPLSSLLRKKG